MYKLKIELMSDLCTADGDGYATVVDTDIATDNHGIPFIPARRLKGCLKDAAHYINVSPDIINKIFGISGNVEPGSLKISNAIVESYDELVADTAENSPEFVTELFTTTAASTAVNEDGSVKENSLRFIRAVDRKVPWERERNLCFYSDIFIDEEYAAEFGRICKALRHIGYKRTRGFGAVKCSLEKFQNENNINLPDIDFKADREYILEYAVRLDENMMLPGTSSSKTTDYISGQAVLGMFAGKYLKNNSADSNFENLFLCGNVKFSNLYITDDAFSEYIPAFLTLGKIKGESGKIVDMTDDQKIEGKIVKPLKSGYISASKKLVSVGTEVVYHNSVHEKNGGLYTQLCIQKGQKFRGSITCNGENMKIISQLLVDGDISFGRSKTAQYSKCSLISAEIHELKNKILHISKNDTVMYVFESDAIISDEYGNISSSIESVKNAVGISCDILPASALKYKTIKGFSSVMRLQRSHIRAVAAGSVIAVKADKSFDIGAVLYVGERQGEGYGKVRILRLDEASESFGKSLEVSKTASLKEQGKIAEMLENMKYKEEMRIKAINYAREKKVEFEQKWGASFIGRVTLMIEESSDHIDLENRISSIKSKSKKSLADDLLKHSESNHYDWMDEKEYLLMILHIAKYMVKQEGKM